MKNQKGFTLIELMVVILIVGILAAVAVPLLHQRRIENACYSSVVAYLNSNHCVKMDYSVRNKEICLRTEKGPGLIFVDLSNDSFFELKEVLEGGEESMGTWTFESKDEALAAPGAVVFKVWYGARKTEN